MLHAQSVMLEPGDSLSHDDHVHMRIACSLEEMAHGCIGGGPYWEWLPPVPAPVALDEPGLVAALASDEPPAPLGGAGSAESFVPAEAGE